MAREGLFNILENNLDISQLRTLDLFGGTGSITYELASRGAAQLTIVEKDTAMYNFITQTVASLKLDNVRVVKMDVFAFIAKSAEQFDFIFAGPPYALATIDDLPPAIFNKSLLSPGGWFVLEHTPRNTYATNPYFVRERNYGTTVFSIFVNSEKA